MESKAGFPDNQKYDSPWIVADREKFRQESTGESGNVGSSTVIKPIRFVDAGPISFNLWFEQETFSSSTKDKGKAKMVRMNAF
jgi:hypothetical protein